MNHRVWVLGVMLLAPLGCVHTQTRLQSEEDGERDEAYKIQTIGDATTVANADPVQVWGVGLVVGLDGTGGGSPPGGYREILEKELKRMEVDNYREILGSPNTSLVLVSALIPAGARKGDPLDIEVNLPPQSRTRSLRGGQLIECRLYNYESAHAINPACTGSDRSVKGHPLVRAKGSLVVGFGDGDEEAKLRRGRIWGGGRCEIDRPFFLVLNEDQQFARVAMRVAERINDTFQGNYPRAPGMETAVPKTKSVVTLGVPSQYKHNLPRYLRVVRMIPLQEAPAPSSTYRRKLEADLLDATASVTAALRLEALGPDSVPILKRGLQSQQALVRFTSAEALAYLGDSSCGEELARLVTEQPALRAYCLTAMASLDESICHLKLEELLACPSAEARYGAFRALRVLEEKQASSLVKGKLLNDSYWLHRVAADSPGLVHISSSRRPEIVLFGEMARLEPPFSFLAGKEITVTAADEDNRCTISRISVRQGTRRKQCSLELEDILTTMSDLGASYPDVIELLRQADRCKCLSCAVKNDALPQAAPVQELARAAKTDPAFLQGEIVQARGDFNLTPTLFEQAATYGLSRRSRETPNAEDAEALLRDSKSKPERSTAQQTGRR